MEIAVQVFSGWGILVLDPGLMAKGRWVKYRRGPFGTPRPHKRPATHPSGARVAVAHLAALDGLGGVTRLELWRVRRPGRQAVGAQDPDLPPRSPATPPRDRAAAGAVPRPPGGAGSGCVERRVVGVAITG